MLEMNDGLGYVGNGGTVGNLVAFVGELCARHHAAVTSLHPLTNSFDL